MNDFFQSRYNCDACGRRVLVGLSYQETVEFEQFDASMPYDGARVWPGAGLPMTPTEERWLTLWRQHETAFAVVQRGVSANE